MNLRRYLDLIIYKTFADLRSEAAKTYIGFLWWVLDPIIFMTIFYIVFGLLMQRGTENYVPFLLTGLVAWRWFQATIIHGANAILAGRGLMRQVYIPKILFPLINMMTDLLKFIVVLAILLVFLWFYGFDINVSYLAFPLVLLVQFTLIAGLTILLSGLVPFLPDLRLLTEHILQLMFFVSGIFYDASQIPEQYKMYFYLNPMANIVEAYRSILMYGQWPDWSALSFIFLVGLGILLIAFRLIKSQDYYYPKLTAG